MVYMKMCEKLRPLFGSKIEMEQELRKHREDKPNLNLIEAGMSLYKQLTGKDITDD